MENVLNLARYICFHASALGIVLSKARLVKLIFLIDWKSAVDNGHQVTNVEWIFNYYGPYVKEIIEEIDNSTLFKKRKYLNHFGNAAEEIALDSDMSSIEANALLEEHDRKIVDYILSITKDMGYMEFLRLVYATYPILKSNKFEKMDLIKLAKEYKSRKTT